MPKLEHIGRVHCTRTCRTKKQKGHSERRACACPTGLDVQAGDELVLHRLCEGHLVLGNLEILDDKAGQQFIFKCISGQGGYLLYNNKV